MTRQHASRIATGKCQLRKRKRAIPRWLAWLLLTVAIGCGSAKKAPPSRAGRDQQNAGAGGQSAQTGSGGAANMPSARGGADASGAAGVDGGERHSDGSAPREGEHDAGTVAVTGTIHGAFTAVELQAQGCDPTRPAILYKASQGSSSVSAHADPGALAPIPCVSLTGLGSTEGSIGVAHDGTVFYAPGFSQDGIGVLKSTDNGAAWSLIVPKFPNDGSHGRVQPYFYLDPTTDRIFFATNAGSSSNSPATSGFDLSWSADQGATWTYVNVVPEAADWLKIFAGPPVSSHPSDYPNIVYLSAPSPISTPIPVVSAIGVGPDYQAFYRSLDGGKTFEQTATLSLKAEDVPGCDPSEWVIFGSGAVAPDGTVYQVLRRCRGLAVAVSRDEGVSWTLQAVTGSTMPAYDTSNLIGIIQNPNVLATELLTVDSAGNVYVTWVDADGVLRLSTSKDHAATWSTPIAVAAPAVKVVRYGALAAAEPGKLALAYYGSTDGVKFDGYIAETADAFDAEPLFWSVTANAASDPLYPRGYETGYVGVVAGADLNEIIQVKYAPNGDLFAAFEKHMCKGSDKNACQWDAHAHLDSVFQGVVGRLVHGVSEAWGTSGTRSEDVSCDDGSATEKQLCQTQAQTEGICEEVYTCVCGSCSCELDACSADPDCTKVRQCAQQNNCTSIDCVLYCQDVLLTAGDLMTGRAMQVSSCATAHDCQISCL